MQGIRPQALRLVSICASNRAARLVLTLGVMGLSLECYSQEVEPEVGSLKTATVSEGTPVVPPQDDVPVGVEALSANTSATRSTEPLRVKPLQTPNTSIYGIGTGTTPEDATQGRLPAAIALPYGPDRQPGWSVSTKNWVAPTFCHYPTYYDDVMLEYHGHERCPPLQPLLSGGRFFTGIFFTPYLMTLQHPHEQVSNAGHFRPGTCAPGVRQRAPYDPTALKVQAAATASGVVLLQP